MSNTWEQPFQVGDKTEPIQSFEAFQIWLEMGAKRSLKAVAERVEKSHDTIKKYSCTWKWSERLQDKLSYENQQIHAKQLESVMTSLDLDNNRDIFLQEVLGNVLFDIQILSQHSLHKFYSNNSKGKAVPSATFELLERFVNIYSKLEDIHSKNQQKFISMNRDCLKVHEFEKQEDYTSMVLHGRKQHLQVRHILNEHYDNCINNKGYDPLKDNNVGQMFLVIPPYMPVGKYKSDANELPTHENDKLE